MVEENTRKLIELDADTHQALMLYKVKRGHKSMNESIAELLELAKT